MKTKFREREKRQRGNGIEKKADLIHLCSSIEIVCEKLLRVVRLVFECLRTCLSDGVINVWGN